MGDKKDLGNNKATPGSRSVTARDVLASIIVTGDNNLINVQQLADYKNALQRYLKRLWQRCNILPLTAMGGEENDQKGMLTLEDVYVDLDTTTKIADKKSEEGEGRRHLAPGRGDEKERPLKAGEAAADSKHMVLLGEPGGGKSTLVKQLVAESAKGLLEGEDAPGTLSEPMLPIFIEVGKMAGLLTKADPANRQAHELDDVLEEVLRHAWQEELDRLRAPSLADVVENRLDDGKIFFVFDGLDEVPEKTRHWVRLLIGLAARLWPDNKMIVTSRIRSWQGSGELAGFDVHTLAPLTEEQVKDFIAAWYGGRVEAGGIDEEAAKSRIADLQQAVAAPGLQKMAANPMLLTVMAIIHEKKVGLPKERVKLFDCAVDILFHRWQVGKAGVKPSAELRAIISDNLKFRPIMEELAFLAHEREAAGGEQSALYRKDLMAYLETALPDYVLAGQFLDYVDQRAGLLVGHGGDGDKYPQTYGFPHRTFQEYLAACRVIRGRRRGVIRQYRILAEQSDFWYVAAQLGAEELLYNRRDEEKVLDLAYALCPVNTELQDESTQRQHVWSGYMAALLGVGVIRADDGLDAGEEGGGKYLQRLIPRLLDIMTGAVLGPLERVEAGRHLAVLGDPRAEVLRPEKMEFIEIEPGPFVMGEGKEEYTHTIDYPYAIARYPVTNAQYRAFVEAGGYEREQYWVEAKADGIWLDDSPRKEPTNYSTPFNLANHPVVGVTWYEALAFCRWLTEMLHEQGLLSNDRQVRLPSEPEWERAARGREGRVYPWGDKPDSNKANYDDTNIGTTSAVGCFTAGASPDKVEELSGNVWEWTRSLDKDYPYKPDDGREKSDAGLSAVRVVRGGSFADFELDARGARRGRHGPGFEDWGWGFRVVFSPFPLKSDTLNSDHLEKQQD